MEEGSIGQCAGRAVRGVQDFYLVFESESSNLTKEQMKNLEEH